MTAITICVLFAWRKWENCILHFNFLIPHMERKSALPVVCQFFHNISIMTSILHDNGEDMLEDVSWEIQCRSQELQWTSAQGRPRLVRDGETFGAWKSHWLKYSLWNIEQCAICSLIILLFVSFNEKGVCLNLWGVLEISYFVHSSASKIWIESAIFVSFFPILPAKASLETKNHPVLEKASKIPFLQLSPKHQTPPFLLTSKNAMQRFQAKE